MSNMNPGMQRQSLSDEAVARLVDPRTGQRLRPLGVVGGRNVYPIMGASPDDPSDGEGAKGGATEDDENENPEGKGSSSEDSDKGGEAEGSKSKDNPDAKIEDLEQEKERHYTRRKEAEKRAEEAEKELRELRKKDQPEKEKVETELKELRTQNESLSGQLRETLLENSFLRDNSYSWHNPSRALRLADLSKVEIDDDGTVHGLKNALDALAKSDPYLISKESKDKDEKEKDKKDLPDTSDKSNKSNREKKNDSEKTREAELRKKYAALRR